MDFKQLLDNIPVVKKEDVLNEKITLEDIQNIHYTLTLDNPLTYIVYLQYDKTLTTEQRNDIYRIIDKLKKNQKNLYEGNIEKQGMEEVTKDNL